MTIDYDLSNKIICTVVNNSVEKFITFSVEKFNFEFIKN